MSDTGDYWRERAVAAEKSSTEYLCNFAEAQRRAIVAEKRLAQLEQTAKAECARLEAEIAQQRVAGSDVHYWHGQAKKWQEELTSLTTDRDCWRRDASAFAREFDEAKKKLEQLTIERDELQSQLNSRPVEADLKGRLAKAREEVAYWKGRAGVALHTLPEDRP